MRITRPVFSNSTPDGRVTGTFLTETGDYRYLEGVVDGDSLKLSCFDGSHAFLFHAALDQDSFRGRFWSGTHWDRALGRVPEPGPSSCGIPTR